MTSKFGGVAMAGVTRRDAVRLAAAGATAAVGVTAAAQDDKGKGPPAARKYKLDTIIWGTSGNERLLGYSIGHRLHIIERDGTFHLDVEVNDRRLADPIPLANGGDEFTIPGFKIKYSVSEVVTERSRLKGVRLKIQGCIGRYCRTLFNDKIVFEYKDRNMVEEQLRSEQTTVTYSYASDTTDGK